MLPDYSNRLNSIAMLFMGGVGTGKTFLACFIANAVIDRGMTAIVAGLPLLIKQLADYQQADITPAAGTKSKMAL